MRNSKRNVHPLYTHLVSQLRTQHPWSAYYNINFGTNLILVQTVCSITLCVQCSITLEIFPKHKCFCQRSGNQFTKRLWTPYRKVWMALKTRMLCEFSSVFWNNPLANKLCIGELPSLAQNECLTSSDTEYDCPLKTFKAFLCIRHANTANSSMLATPY